MKIPVPVFLALCLWAGPANRCPAASPGDEIFREAEEAYLEGDFKLGGQKLEDLIASHPGDFDLAARALHRMCLSDYADLVSRDWPSGGFPSGLFKVSGRDHSRMWESLSGFLEEAFLEYGRHAREGGVYPFPPPRALESLWRKRADYPLTPLKEVSTSAADRILALRRSGYLENDSSAVVDASILLYFIRRNQKRYEEASSLVDGLVEAKNGGVDWLLARAKFHAEISSNRAEPLLRSLFAKLDKPRVDKAATRASIRARPLRQAFSAPPPERILPGQPWIRQLTSEREDPAWKTFSDGFIQGLEEQIDLWIQGTFSEAEDEVYLLRRDGTGSAVTWNVIDDHLKSLGKGAVAGLRKFQEKGCRLDPMSMEPRISSQAGKLSLFRRYPWSRTAHAALLEYARGELRAGREQAARSAFREVMEHTLDETLSKRARVGSWLALSQSGKADELKSELAAHAGQAFPWMQEELETGEIGKILTRGLVEDRPPDRSPRLAQLKIKFLQLPACRLWNPSSFRYCSGIEFVTLQKAGSGLLASTRNLLARYEPGRTDRPLWFEVSPTQGGRSAGRPGSFRPAVSGRTVFARWGYGADPGKLIALDLESREILWSLDVCGPPSAGRKLPLGNPVLSGGHLYVASAWSNRSGTSVYTLRLSCIDASDGKVIWQSDQEILLPMVGGGNPSFEGTYGDCLTIAGGKVYCSPGTGFVARFDARAGKMEWMHNYRPFSINRMIADSMGTAPLPQGDLLFCLPRDSNTVTALNARTGELAWKSYLTLPKEILGIREGRVLIRGLTGLVALDVRSGEVVWQSPYPEDFLRQVYLRGNSIYLSAGERLYRHEAATGIELETLALPKYESTLHHFAMLEDEAYFIGAKPSPGVREEFSPRGPDRQLWELPSNDVKAFHSDDLDFNKSKLLLVHNEVLTCMQAQTGRILWESFIFPTPLEVYFHEGKAILASLLRGRDIRLEAYDLEDGSRDWKLDLPRLRSGHGSIFGRSGKYLYGRDNTDGYVLADLGKGEVVMRNRVSRRNGQVKPGFGAGRVHFMIIPAYRTGLEWLSWDISRNEFVGEKEPLRGVDEDPSKTFDRIKGNWLEDAHYGPDFCYFVNRQDLGNREYVAYRADYRDRGVRVLARSPGKIKLKAPYFFLQQEQSESNKKTRTHTWKIRKMDDPDYSHTLDLGHSWDGQSLLQANCALEVRTPHRNQNPYLVQGHDLATKKIVFSHSSDSAERMGVLATGPKKVLVYEYKRNNREREPYFTLTPYDLETGAAGSPISIDYWTAARHNPHRVELVGNLLLIREHQTLRAWRLPL